MEAAYVVLYKVEREREREGELLAQPPRRGISQSLETEKES
jgi:hypothetical protein